MSAAGCVVLVTVVLVLPGALSGSTGLPAGSVPNPVATVPHDKAGQTLDEGGGRSCVYAYSPDEVAARTDFAFDGTVVAIGAGQSNRGDSGDLTGLAGVTLSVNEWFHGGSQDTVAVDLPAPARSVLGVRISGGPEYEVGTRLLVSGAARWGGDDPLASAIAWSCGGFTRHYSVDDAAAWAAAEC